MAVKALSCATFEQPVRTCGGTRTSRAVRWVVVHLGVRHLQFRARTTQSVPLPEMVAGVCPSRGRGRVCEQLKVYHYPRWSCPRLPRSAQVGFKQQNELRSPTISLRFRHRRPYSTAKPKLLQHSTDTTRKPEGGEIPRGLVPGRLEDRAQGPEVRGRGAALCRGPECKRGPDASGPPPRRDRSTRHHRGDDSREGQSARRGPRRRRTRRRRNSETGRVREGVRRRFAGAQEA